METKSNAQNIQKAISKKPPSPSAFAPVCTIADLQRSFESNGPIIIGDTTLPNKAEIFNEISALITEDIKRENWHVALCCGLVCCPCAIFLLPCVYFNYRDELLSHQNKLESSDFRYIIRLEGDQWSRYIAHINTDIQKNKKKTIQQKLRERGYGYILLSSQGFSVDALLDVAYGNKMFVRSEVIKAPSGIDMMLRIWFRHRTAQYAESTPFKFDIFLPSHMSTEQLSSIINFIKNESKCMPCNTVITHNVVHEEITLHL